MNVRSILSDFFSHGSRNSPTARPLQRRGTPRQGTGRYRRDFLRDELHRFAGQRLVVAFDRSRDHGADLQQAALEACLERFCVVPRARRRQVGGCIRPDVRSEYASRSDERRHAPRVRLLNEQGQSVTYRTGRLTDRRMMSGIEQTAAVRCALFQSVVDEIDGRARQVVADARFSGQHPLPAPGNQKRFQWGVPEPRLKRSVPACSHFVIWEEDSHSATEFSAPPGISPMEILSIAPSMVGSYALILSAGGGREAYLDPLAGSIPCRSLTAAAAGDAMNSRSRRAAAGSPQEIEIAPEKVVML